MGGALSRLYVNGWDVDHAAKAIARLYKIDDYLAYKITFEFYRKANED